MTDYIYTESLYDIICEEAHDFEEVARKEFGAKHDNTRYVVTFQHIPTGTFWNIGYQSSYDYGIDEDYIEPAYQVEPVEVTTIQYKAIKNG